MIKKFNDIFIIHVQRLYASRDMLPHVCVMSRRSRAHHKRRRLVEMHNGTRVDDQGADEHIEGDGDNIDDAYEYVEGDDYEDVDVIDHDMVDNDDDDDEDYQAYGDDQGAMEEFLSYMFPPILEEWQEDEHRVPTREEAQRSRLDEAFEELEAHASLPLFEGAKMSVLSSSLLLLDW